MNRSNDNLINYYITQGEHFLPTLCGSLLPPSPERLN